MWSLKAHLSCAADTCRSIFIILLAVLNSVILHYWFSSYFAGLVSILFHKLLFPVFLRRTEFKAYRDVKPVKMIRAKSQYLPPDEKTSLETSYSATFKAQYPLQPADNKALERRRIRSLYSEPYIDPTKQVRAHLPYTALRI